MKLLRYHLISIFVEFYRLFLSLWLFEYDRAVCYKLNEDKGNARLKDHFGLSNFEVVGRKFWNSTKKKQKKHNDSLPILLIGSIKSPLIADRSTERKTGALCPSLEFNIVIKTRRVKRFFFFFLPFNRRKIDVINNFEMNWQTLVGVMLYLSCTVRE
jgi:hypothetical protein